MIQPWKKIGSKPSGNYKIFSIRTDIRVSPRTGREHEFYIIESGSWVNVVAITTDNQLVMIEQYRPGTDTIELEIPGGMVDKTDPSPLAGGVRELREETGYEGEGARIIGEILPNPALMGNVCYTVLVTNCQPKHPVQWDSGEDIITRLVPVAEIPKLVSSGRVRHSLVAVALYHYENLLRHPVK
jgi:8-oxo-dGTP pyrophosphatase MutT (NUDIX family)